MPKGRGPEGEIPLSNAERQARDQQPAAIVHTRRRVDRRSRPQRWGDAVTELLALQGAYAAWLEALPDTLQGTATADALQAIADLDLDSLAAIDPPSGYGRDSRHAVVRPVRTAARWCLARATASRAALCAPASAGFGP